MRLLGFGGIFLRTKNHEKMIEWYDQVFEVNLGIWNGTAFVPMENNMTVFSLFDEENDYFGKDQNIMLSFQIDDMEEFLGIIKMYHLNVLKELIENDYGKFIWIEDPDGNWVEVWQK